LLGVSPYAFKMVIGLTILVAISLSNFDLAALAGHQRGRRGLGRLD
jgi:simple sugar transport system permease protein